MCWVVFVIGQGESLGYPSWEAVTQGESLGYPSWVVELQKRGPPLGLNARCVDDRLRVHAIDERSLASEWKAEHPEQAVRSGDYITQVKGVAGRAGKKGA